MRYGKPPVLRRRNQDPAEWAYTVEAVDMLPFGRYRIYLTVELFMRYGAGEGWGWLAWTLAGAHRKGARELARYRRKRARLAERQRAVDRSTKHADRGRG